MANLKKLKAVKISQNNLLGIQDLSISDVKIILNEEMNKVHSIEKIVIGGDFKFRHFVTNSKNELYEDNDGNIYVSADRKGIYKLSFTDFRN